MIEDTLRNEMIELYNKTFNYKFQKKTYESDIEELKKIYGGVLTQVAKACEGPENELLEVASYVPEYVAEEIAAIKNKRKRELAALDYNMNMVSYFVPLIGEAPSLLAEDMTKKMVEIWNEKMPEYKIGHSTFHSIQGGFKKGVFCYITTAVCQSLNKPDDCYELTTLRKYRDEYLLASPEGEEIVEEYYNIAPTIVKRIGKEENAADIYRKIWEEYLSPCIRLIEEGKKEECKYVYSDMVKKLEKRYLYS